MTGLIDADEFLKNEIKRCGCVPLIGSCTSDNENFKFILEQQPTVDAVEVVRCEDCKHRFAFCCHKHRMYVNRDDFCSWGAKMDGGDK